MDEKLRGAAILKDRIEKLNGKYDHALGRLIDIFELLQARDRDCDTAVSILRGAISALHSMNDPVQANARQQIQMAIDALNVGATR